MSLYRRFNDRFGTAGVVLGMIALILALGGTALAAKGALTGKQKKEVEKIAKKYAGEPGAPGAQGPAGPQGPAGANGKDGAKGDRGDSGTDGTNGTNGSNGTSATAAAYTGPECEDASGEAGVVVHSASADSYVYNGEDGQTGFTETLPSGATETGAIAGDALSSETASPVRTDVPISFSIPLAAELDAAHVLVIYEAAAVPTACENAAHAGTASAANPEASSGYLCVYLASDNSESTSHTVHVANATSDEGASTAGADLVLLGGEAGWPFHGTWAVTG
jgi:hypothetical protein